MAGRSYWVPPETYPPREASFHAQPPVPMGHPDTLQISSMTSQCFPGLLMLLQPHLLQFFTPNRIRSVSHFHLPGIPFLPRLLPQTYLLLFTGPQLRPLMSPTRCQLWPVPCYRSPRPTLSFLQERQKRKGQCRQVLSERAVKRMCSHPRPQEVYSKYAPDGTENSGVPSEWSSSHQVPQ